MKEILNELENKNEVSLASINNKKHDKTNNMQYIFSVHIIYQFYDILSILLKFWLKAEKLDIVLRGTVRSQQKITPYKSHSRLFHSFCYQLYYRVRRFRDTDHVNVIKYSNNDENNKCQCVQVK